MRRIDALFVGIYDLTFQRLRHIKNDPVVKVFARWEPTKNHVRSNSQGSSMCPVCCNMWTAKATTTDQQMTCRSEMAWKRISCVGSNGHLKKLRSRTCMIRHWMDCVLEYKWIFLTCTTATEDRMRPGNVETAARWDLFPGAFFA